MSGLSETLFSSPNAAALQALKRKKRYEKQLAQIDGTLSTIEFQREALENANTNTEVLKNMGYAAKAMKAAHDNMYVAPAGGGGTHAQGHAGCARPQSQTPPLIHSGTQVCSNFHLFWNSSEMDYGALLPLEADLME